jgi:hypothetical protein
MNDADDTPRRYIGHDPYEDVDYLVTIWADGTAELAYRDGTNQYRVVWSPPVLLKEATE